MVYCRRHRVMMAVKIGLSLFLIACFILYSSSNQNPSQEPLLQQATAEKYSGEERREINEEKEKVDVETASTCSNCDLDAANAVHLAVVACGDRMPETAVLLKSAVMFTSPSTRLHFHIFTESELEPHFREALDSWPLFVRLRFNYTVRPINFPDTEDFQKWKVLFKPCASQRLFLPNILTNVNLLLYVDTDILFLKSTHLIWNHFKKFNSSQLAALAPEHEDKSIGWYNRFAMHPYYGELGVNSGVMLMHLDRMRTMRWEKKMIAYQEQFDKKIVWGDQDLINIFFSYYPDKLFVYPCQWNYRPDHCMYNQNCHSAVEKGVSILHGNRRAFHNDKQPAFKVVFNAIEQFDFVTGDPNKDLVERIQTELRVLAGNNCAAHSNALVKSIRTSIKNIPRQDMT